MAKRRSSLCDSQIVFDFGVPERASEAGDMAGFSKMVAGSVSKMLGQDGRDRQAIAKAMSQLMGERVSKEMLDAYASEAREPPAKLRGCPARRSCCIAFRRYKAQAGRRAAALMLGDDVVEVEHRELVKRAGQKVAGDDQALLDRQQ